MLATATLVLGLAACGSDPQLSATAAADLGARVDKIDAAVERGDTEGAAERLLALQKAVAEWLASGELSQERATQILTASTAVAARIDTIAEANPTPTPTVTVVVTETATATETVEAEWPPGKDKDKDKHEDEDEGFDDDEDD